MKLSVITLHAVRNYGSVLQTYATQHIFENMGFETEIIDYRREALSFNSVANIIKNKQYGLLMKLKLFLILPSTKKSDKVFEKFLKKYINLSKNRYSVEEDFKKNPVVADIYCTGSDQVWNSGWHCEIPHPFFLSFAPDNKKLISFSASFGKNELDEWEKLETKKLLERYDYISVRENSAIKILENLGIHDGIEVLDPTLAVKSDIWYDFAAHNNIKGKYILIYQLCNNKNFDNYAKKIAKIKGLKLIRLCTRYDQVRKSGKSIIIPKIETFLSLFRYAEYIITDSFHATVFSLIFHKKFLCIYPNQYSTRLESILNLLKLESRHLEDFTNLTVIDEEIDYKRVDNILSEKRTDTLEFLKKATNIT